MLTVKVVSVGAEPGEEASYICRVAVYVPTSLLEVGSTSIVASELPLSIVIESQLNDSFRLKVTVSQERPMFVENLWNFITP